MCEKSFHPFSHFFEITEADEKKLMMIDSRKMLKKIRKKQNEKNGWKLHGTGKKNMPAFRPMDRKWTMKILQTMFLQLALNSQKDTQILYSLNRLKIKAWLICTIFFSLLFFFWFFHKNRRILSCRNFFFVFPIFSIFCPISNYVCSLRSISEFHFSL